MILTDLEEEMIAIDSNKICLLEGTIEVISEEINKEMVEITE
jgi:hypothetical protein